MNPGITTARAGEAIPRVARRTRVTIVASQFNRPITAALVRGATGVLRHYGVPERAIRLIWVPGAFELPVVASMAARGPRRPDAIIALGALIRGETPQYQVLAHAVAQGLCQVAVQAHLPVTFGVIVADTLAQARARAGVPARRRRRPAQPMNRGAEAALAALSLLRLRRQL